jgi:hypothetical protein
VLELLRPLGVLAIPIMEVLNRLDVCVLGYGSLISARIWVLEWQLLQRFFGSLGLVLQCLTMRKPILFVHVTQITSLILRYSLESWLATPLSAYIVLFVLVMLLWRLCPANPQLEGRKARPQFLLQ